MNGEPGTVLEKVPESALPASCAEAFELFEREFGPQLAQQPEWLDRRLGGFEAAFFPDYDHIKPASWVRILGMVGCWWAMVLVVVAVLTLGVVFLLPESLMRPGAFGVLALGGLGLVGVTVWYLGSEVRENRRKRARGRPPAFGTFLLADALVQRYETRSSYYPRASILEVFEKAVRGGGGSSGPSRAIGHSCEIRFHDAQGKERKTTVFGTVSSWHPSPEGPRTQRVRKWFAQTG